MATTYDSIYDRFLGKITDYELAALVDTDLQNRLYKYLKSAITDFKYCINNLSDRDEVNKQFIANLTETEQEILSKFMLVYWIDPHVLRLENIRNSFNNKDFNLASPANMLDKLTNLKTSLSNEANQEMVFYYYAT